MNDLKGRIRHTREFEIKKNMNFWQKILYKQKNGFEPSNQRREI